MNLLTNGRSSNEDYDADISFVFVEVTPKLARLILRRAAAFKALKRKDKKALETYYWDGSATYLRYDKVGEQLASKVNTDLIVEMKKPIDYLEGENVECDQMLVDEEAVTFTAIPKHSNIYVSSERIPLSTIRKALKKG